MGLTRAPRAVRPAGDVAAVVWLLVGALALIWGAMGLWAWGLLSQGRLSAERALVRQRALVAQQVEGVFKLAEVSLSAANRWIADNPGADPRTDPRFAQLAIALKEATHETMLLRLVDAGGVLSMVPALRGATGISVADRDYFKQAMQARPGAVFVSTPYQGRVSGRWLLAASTRLSRPSHGIVLAFVSIEVSMFDDAFERARLGEGGSIALFRRDAVLLARSATKRGDLGKNISPSVVFRSGVARNREGLIETDGRQVDGVPRLVAYGALNSYPLVVTTGMALRSINEDERRAVLQVALLLLVGSALAAAAAWRFVALRRALADGRSALDHAATHDALTGRLNRARFFAMADDAIRHAVRHREPTSVLALRLDHLRGLNERLGRSVGDEALRSFASACAGNLREADLFGRIAGSEFCVLAPTTDLAAATELAERLRQAVAAAEVGGVDAAPHITASVGVTTFGSADAHFEDLYVRADRALRKARDEGRDRVCVEAPRLPLTR